MCQGVIYSKIHCKIHIKSTHNPRILWIYTSHLVFTNVTQLASTYLCLVGDDSPAARPRTYLWRWKAGLHHHCHWLCFWWHLPLVWALLYLGHHQQLQIQHPSLGLHCKRITYHKTGLLLWLHSIGAIRHITLHILCSYHIFKFCFLKYWRLFTTDVCNNSKLLIQMGQN